MNHVEPTVASAPSSASDAARYESLLREAAAIRGVSLWNDARRRLRRNRVAYSAFYLLIAVALLSLGTPLLPLQPPVLQNLANARMPPTMRPARLGLTRHNSADKDFDKWVGERWHQPGPVARRMIRARLSIFGDWCVPSLCGTDDLGRDLLSRVMWGSRVSLAVSVVAALVSLMIGVSYGATAGYLGGWVDALMMRLVDVLYSVPFIFVVIFVMTFLSEEKVKRVLEERYHIDRIIALYLLIGGIYWLTMSRVVRGQVISLKHDQFIDAARVTGAGRMRIIFRHLVPNVMAIVIVYLTLTIPSVMLFESFLSFVGLGVQPPDVSWGQLMGDSIKSITPIRIYWWLVFFPGLAMTLTLFALNFLGDGLRDALDPRMKNK